MSLTNEHLVIGSKGNLRRADTLQVGEILFDGSIINNITYIIDVPLTPVVLSGKMKLPNSSDVVVSCWSHGIENANKMDKLMLIAQPYTKRLSPEVISQMMHAFYTEFISNDKDMNNLAKIMERVENNNCRRAHDDTALTIVPIITETIN